MPVLDLIGIPSTLTATTLPMIAAFALNELDTTRFGTLLGFTSPTIILSPVRLGAKALPPPFRLLGR